jgi:hypothetical protein
LWSSAAARGGKDRASGSFGKGAYFCTQTIRRFLIETARVRCSANQQSNTWVRRISQRILPAFCRLPELFRRNGGQWDERFDPPGMRRQAKVPATNRKIVQVGDMSAFAPHLHKAGMIVALFFDPTCDMGGTPAGGNNQVRPGSREYSRLRSFETKARGAKHSQQYVVKMNKRGETQCFHFVWPTQSFCEAERLCGVSWVIVSQYPHSGIVAKATAPFV